MSTGYSYNKEKLKQRQGRAIYGLIGQQLGGLGGVVAGGTKGGTAGILGNYALGSVAGLGAGYLAGAHLPVGGNRQLDSTVESAIKHYKKTGKKNATFRDLEQNYDLKLSKQAALENFYMCKSARHEAYYNYLMVKEGKLLPILQRGVNSVQSGLTNMANKATMRMGNYRVAPGGPVLGQSFDAGLAGGTPAHLLERNRSIAVNQLMTNPHVRQQAMADIKVQGMNLLTQAQVGGGNWAVARQLGSNLDMLF